MADAESPSFSSFWHRSVDRLSPRKVKFTPNVTKPRGMSGEDTATSALTQKQHRRAQVRRAQIEHRQRKENYVKHLEQDVAELRAMISQAETESMSFRNENSAIKNMLVNLNLPSSPPNDPTNSQYSEGPSPLSDFVSFQQTPNHVTPLNLTMDYQSPQHDLHWPSSASSSLVSVHFDELIEANCLQVSPTNGYGTTVNIKSGPHVFNKFSIESLSLNSPEAAIHNSANPALLKPLPDLPDGVAITVPPPAPQDLSAIAINFILSLEHPCRTHFHANAGTANFNPKGDPSGHELMASTFLYSNAPAPIFSNLDTAEWKSPSLDLLQLHEMSKSLDKNSDFEITPVQAWFLLVGAFDAGRLLAGEGKLEQLKKRLGGLVQCFAFGAVMDVRYFWDVVRSVMGDGGSGGLKSIVDPSWS